MFANSEHPLFTIRLVGEGVRPHLIPASDLARLLVAAEQSALAIAAREHPEEADELIAGLAEVRDESIGVAFSSNREQIAPAPCNELPTVTSNRNLR